MPRITKVKFLEVLDGLIGSFKKEVLREDDSNAAKAFLALHSYLSTTTSDKDFPKERIERLYNALFSKYEGDQVSEKPLRSYDDWRVRAEKLASRVVTESSHVYEGDDIQFDWDYFSKELVRDLILGGASAGFIAAGNIPLAAASIAVPAIIHGVNTELDKRGKSLDRGKFTKLLNHFRDTFDKLERDMEKFIVSSDFTEPQLSEIEESANSIYRWWKNNATNLTKDWDKYGDREIVEFMDKYNEFISDVSREIVISKAQSVSSETIINMFDELIGSVESDPEYKETLADVFIVISTMLSVLYEADNGLKSLDSKVAKLYDAVFAEYNEYGKMVKKAPMSYEALKAFMSKNASKIDSSVKWAQDNMGESKVDESFEGIKKFFSKASKGIASTVSNAINVLFFEVALYGKMILTGAMSLGPVLAILGRRVTYYAAEDVSAKVMDKAFKNVSSDKVRDKIVEILREIRDEIASKKEELDSAIAANSDSVSRAVAGIRSNMKTVNEGFVMKTFEEYCQSL